MLKLLKYLRRIVAIVVGGGLLLYFLDIINLLPMQFHALAHIQIVPALLAGSVGILVVMGLVTLLFGRVYCSVICPLGVLQDAILRVKKWSGRIAKRSNSLRIKYIRPLNVVRYGVLAIVAVPLLFGVTYPLLLLDPYSSFGRMAVSLMRPIAVWINNIAASILNDMGNYSMYNIPQLEMPLIVIVLSVVVAIALVVMVVLRGRLWCNTICPVGALLGLISRFSLFRITLNADRCNGCSVCAAKCKAHCIDHKNHSVDTSRCVACFNCTSGCKRNAIDYKPTGWSRKQVVADGEQELDKYAVSRRRFLQGSMLAVASLPATTLLGRALTLGSETESKRIYPLPPGAVSLERFASKCTACQLCVDKCPTHVLQPAFMENGLTGMMQPYMRFKTESFCNYECRVCSQVCPTGAIMPITVEQKKLTRVGIAQFDMYRCKVFIAEVDCGACAEHCPSQAVHMVDYVDGLTIPQVEERLCIGCGGCESICPMSPPAIYINGVEEQSLADVPSDDVLEVGEVSEFGF